MTAAENSVFDEFPDDFPEEDVNPDRLMSCAYWRCGELFESRSANHRFCRKACRSRQKKWQKSVDRRAARSRSKSAAKTVKDQ